MSDKPIMGYAWYDEKSFDALRGIMPDMSEHYDDWLSGAQRDVTRALSEGYRVIRIAVRPEPFMEWCRRRNVSMPGLAARRAFAAEQARLLVRAERQEKGLFGLF